MSDITYSSGAINILPEFHRRKYVVYVEGVDDVPFWNAVFEAFGLNDFIIKPAGGKNEINKYTELLISDNANIYIARDTDYQNILHDQITHPRIAWTFGYSIENSLYHPSQISDVIAIYSKTQEFDDQQTEEWMNNFSNAFYPLIVYELINEQYHFGYRILGDNCCQYLESPKSHIPSLDRINSIAEEFQDKFSDLLVRNASNQLTQHITMKPSYFVIRGHFLANAVINYIKNEVQTISQKRQSISVDNLTTNLIIGFKTECVLHRNRQDIHFLFSQISSWIT